ncbi:MAG TPA: hypothetical protein VFY29_14205 [Terriglobia bacterium]|nr:hypothetical protein [Terriglobia bacterium]
MTAGAQDGQVDPRQVDPRQLDPRQFDPTAGGFGGANFVAPRRLTGTATVVVSDRDIDNLVVTVTPAATIQGQIRVDGQIPPTTTLQQMRIQLQEVGTATRATGGLSASAQPQADGSFRLDNVAAGAYRVMVLALGGGGFGGGGRGGFGGGGFGGGGGGAPARGGPATPINVYLKESRFQGADALDSPLRISGPATGTLDLVVGFGSGQISGVVADSRFQPAPVTQVVLVPARSRSRTELFKTATTDENGRFTITNIAPGDYRVFSWEAVEPYGWFDPDLLAASEAGGQAVQISEGSAASIELRMIPAGGAR